jgi:hypothetical protein
LTTKNDTAAAVVRNLINALMKSPYRKWLVDRD